MARYRIEVGELPPGGSVDAFWGIRGAPKAKIGTFGTPSFEVTIPNVGSVEIEVYPKDAKGVRGFSKTIWVDTYTDKPANRPAVKDLTIPDPVVVLSDGVLHITPGLPAGFPRGEKLRYEIRASERVQQTYLGAAAGAGGPR